MIKRQWYECGWGFPEFCETAQLNMNWEKTLFNDYAKSHIELNELENIQLKMGERRDILLSNH